MKLTRMFTQGFQFSFFRVLWKASICRKTTWVTIIIKLTPTSSQKLCALDLLVMNSADTCDATPMATKEPRRCMRSTSMVEASRLPATQRASIYLNTNGALRLHSIANMIRVTHAFKLLAHEPPIDPYQYVCDNYYDFIAELSKEKEDGGGHKGTQELRQEVINELEKGIVHCPCWVGMGDAIDHFLAVHKIIQNKKQKTSKFKCGLLMCFNKKA